MEFAFILTKFGLVNAHTAQSVTSVDGFGAQQDQAESRALFRRESKAGGKTRGSVECVLWPVDKSKWKHGGRRDFEEDACEVLERSLFFTVPSLWEP
ncbi:hypothetical protein BaRGS_00024215 [Batillaria attramentaria]|uniref:Secreted protein n=1 Tax=Batillaria attramentaria TaxID=370345 RepID=A0ABD0KBU9_9CAEN